MAKKSIEITIGTDGKAKIEAIGYAGKGCVDATKAIEEALGVVTARTEKAEARQPTVGVANTIKK